MKKLKINNPKIYNSEELNKDFEKVGKKINELVEEINKLYNEVVKKPIYK